MEEDIDSPKQGSGAEQLGFPVRRVPLDAPWDWLSRGWGDLCAVPSLSLAYGACFSVVAWVILFVLSFLEATSLVPVLAAGFLLVAPLLAAGLYEMSRRLEKGERVTMRDVFAACAPASGRLGFFGVVLFLAFFAWVELAFLLLTLFLGGAGAPDPSEFVHTPLFTNAGLALLFTGTLTGAILAAIVFSICSVAVPLLLVKNTDAVTAIATSVRAVRLNTGTMLLWAALIAGYMVLGTWTLFVGLVVIFPLLGHATWHAFRALVEVDGI